MDVPNESRNVLTQKPAASTDNMSGFPQITWLEAFRDRVNADPEMKLVGNWFTASISLSFGDMRYVLHVNKRMHRRDRGESTARCARGIRIPRSARSLAQVPERQAAAALS